MNLLLDTNICIALINESSDLVSRRLQRAFAVRHRIFVSSISVFELWYRAFRSSRVRFNTDRLEAFLEAPLTILTFDEEDARAAGLIHAELRASGKLIGSYDILIAAQAVDKSLTLVTSNMSDFSRVQRLACQDWSRS